MEMSSLRAFVFGVQRAVLGVDVTLTLIPSADPIATRGIWLPEVDEVFPAGRDLQKREPRRILALPVTVAGRPPRGAVVMAPLPGATEARAWRVDGVDRVDGDQVRVILTAVF